MVLTVTINPLLENRIDFNSVTMGKVNRGLSKKYYAGGKGINVSRQLDYLGIKNTALLFLGGNNGKILRKVLINENLNFTSVSQKGETRSATLVVEKKKNRVTSFFEPGSKLSENEISEFKNKLNKMIQNCSIVIFSGSVPNEEAASIIVHGIELAHKYDKISFIDTYGSHLKDCLDAAPTMIHNNIPELEKSLNISLKTETEKVKLLKTLYNKGIKLAYITNGAKATYASKFDFIYRITSPKIKEIDATGSGDAFVAGIAYGFEKALVFDEFVKIASALGSLNAARWDVCNVATEEVEKTISSVSVKHIGKKMKLLDDSPTHS